MSQGLNPFILSVPSNLNFDLATDFALVAADLFQKLSPSLTNGGGYGYSWAQFDCQSLEEESLQRLQNIKMVSTSLSKFKPAPTVLGECMNCHSIDADKRGIPSIPFDRTGSLRNYLQAGSLSKILERIQKTGPGQMPPYRSLSADEKDQLHRNLELIAK